MDLYRRPLSRPASPALLLGGLAPRGVRCALDPGRFRSAGWGRPIGRGSPRGLLGLEPEAVFSGGLEALDEARRWLDPRPDRPALSAVLIGVLGYSLGEALADRPRLATGPRPTGGAARSADPDVWLAGYRAVYAHDPVRARGAVLGGDAAAVERLAARLEALRPGPAAVPKLAEPVAFTADAEYRAQLARVQAYIRAGDVYQVNLSRRLDVAGTAPDSAAALFRALHERAPAPFAALVETPLHSIVSNSPERFLRVEGERIETCPIKGTRPRGADAALDRALAAELERSAKDRAEHIMIVDLERNDLGRICRTGSVQVRELARRIELPTVHHLVSSIAGVLCSPLSWAELLRATFPGGSITGAPKLRAMEIIAELEPVPRGIYTGAIGYFDAAGGIDLSIAIRSAVLQGGLLSLHVGGGIVADSDPAAELAETWDKARAFRALCAGGAP